MTYQHKTLAAGRWNEFSLVEQMANIGSEIERAINWKAKNNLNYANKAFERSLELFDLTMDCPQLKSRLKEVCRARELWVDYFWGDNDFSSTEKSWKSYFLAFAYAARK